MIFELKSRNAKIQAEDNKSIGLVDNTYISQYVLTAMRTVYNTYRPQCVLSYSHTYDLLNI